MYISLSVVAVLFLLLMWWATGLFAVFLFPLLAGMCLWIARLIWGSPGYNERSRWQGTAALGGIGLFLVPVIAGYPFFAWEVQSVMQGYALRGVDVAVRLSDENLDNLRAAARLYAIPIEECASNAPTTKIVKLEALLWHGIGERSLVEWSGKQLNTGRIVTVSAELKREGIFVIRGAGGLLQGCQAVQP